MIEDKIILWSMVQCAAFGCKNRSGETAKKTISYHRFPKHPVLRRAWGDAALGPQWSPSNRSVLCSNHFEEDCFDLTGQTVRLREVAVPTIFLYTPEKVNSIRKFSKHQVIVNNFSAESGATVGQQTVEMTMGMTNGENFQHGADLSAGSGVFGTKMAKAKASDEQTSKLCRLCGKLKEDVTAIFSEKGTTLKLREKLEHLLRITVNEEDKLPKHVCDKCVMQLNMCDSMMEFFIQTQSSLQQKVLNSEPTHDETPVSTISNEVIPTNVLEPQVSVESPNSRMPVGINESEDNDISDMQGTNNTEFDPATLDEDVLFSMHGINVALPVQCDFCEKMFDNLDIFDEHIASHKEQRVFACQLCSNTYVSWSNLVAHRRACHGGNVLSCDKCNSRTYHPDLTPVNYVVRGFPVGCEECEEGFTSMVELSRHYRVSVSHHCTGTAQQDQVMCSTNDDNWNEVGTNNEDGDTDSLHDTLPVNNLAADIATRGTSVVDGLQPSAMCVDFVCSMCGGQFPTSEELDQHVAKLQGDSPGLLCALCDIRFCDKVLFASHQQLHSSNHNHVSLKDIDETDMKENQPKCEHCNGASDCKHVNSMNINPSKETLACFDCSVTYEKLEQLETHVTNMHSRCKAVTCDVCRKRYGAKIFICHYVECVATKHNDDDLLHLHKKTCLKCIAPALTSKRHTYSNFKKKVHTCEVCHKQIDTLEKIVLHAKSHYGPNESNLPAKYVEMIRLLDSKKQLNQSSRGEQETCRCEYCGKVFVNKLALLTHVRLHTKTNTHVCQLCSKAFVTEKHLMVHVLRHTNEQLHECYQCFKVFTSLDALQAHQMTHKSSSYTCPHCDKTLSCRLSYLGHIRLHTGERPFRCTLCSKAFTLKQRLSLHMKLKHASSVSSSDDNEGEFDEIEGFDET